MVAAATFSADQRSCCLVACKGHLNATSCFDMSRSLHRSYSSFGERRSHPQEDVGHSSARAGSSLNNDEPRPNSNWKALARIRSLSVAMSRKRSLFEPQPEPQIIFADSQTDADAVPKPTRKRLVEKNGKLNVRTDRVPHRRYANDIFTTMIDARWKWVVIAFLVLYVSSWTCFGFLWWLIVELRSKSTTSCIVRVKTFTDAFLFSVETQQTIGYGGRMITNQCPEAIILLLMQSVVGCILDAVLLGLIFAKISRPGKRASTIFFSDHATICTRNGNMYMVFQVGDLRKRQLLDTHIRLHLFRTVKTTEGRTIYYNQENLRVAFDFLNPYYPDYDTDRLLLLHPIMIYHPIEERSPFYNMSPYELLKSDWEVVAILEGTVEATGSTVQAKTSYLGDEILWGHDFECAATPADWCDEFGLRYPLSRINNVFLVDLPKCSPKEYLTTWQMASFDKDDNDADNDAFADESVAVDS